MSWLTISAVALFGLGLGVIAIAVVENHRRVAPVVARWEFAGYLLLGGAMATTAWDHFEDRNFSEAAITAVIVLVLLWVGLTTFRSRRRVERATENIRR